MTITANERITIKGTLNYLTKKPSSYRACFFSYESFISPDTNGWYDDDGELNAELITSLEFASHDSEAPVTWEESDGTYPKDRLKEILTHMSIYDLKEAEKYIKSKYDDTTYSTRLVGASWNLLFDIESEICNRSKV